MSDRQIRRLGKIIKKELVKQGTMGFREYAEKSKRNNGGVPTWAWCITWGLMLASLIHSFFK